MKTFYGKISIFSTKKYSTITAFGEERIRLIYGRTDQIMDEFH